jgi:hypothetical protein
MSEQDEQTRQREYDRKAGLSATQHADQVGIQSQHEQVAKRQFNPGFFKETAALDADTEFWDWLENELGAKGSRAHVLGNRPEEYAEQQMLLNANQAERMIAEREPGRLQKKNPVVYAVSQGLDPLDGQDRETLETIDWLDHPDAIVPISTDGERRQYRDLAELMTTRETLAIGGIYVDALTTATTETRHQDRVEDQASGTTRRLRSVFA